MNAYELADDVDDVLDVLVANRILNPSIEKEVLRQAATMLRQQQVEIEALKEALQAVITISDRKHDAWDKAKELLK